MLRVTTIGVALLAAGCACNRIAEADSTWGCWVGYGSARSDSAGAVLVIREQGPMRQVLTYLDHGRPVARHGLLPDLAVPDSTGAYVVISSLLTQFTVWGADAGKPIRQYEVKWPPVHYGEVLAADEPGCWICVPSHGSTYGGRTQQSAPLQLITADGRQEPFGAPPLDGVTHLATYCGATRDVFLLTTQGTLFVVNRDDRAKDWIGAIGFAPKQFGAAVVGNDVFVANGASLVGVEMSERRVFDVPLAFAGEVASVSSAVGNRFVVGVTLERTPERTRSELVCCEVRADAEVSVVWRQTLPKHERIGAVVYMPQWGGTVVMSPDGPPRFVPFPEGAGAR